MVPREFVPGILSNPDDDTARLVLADALEEAGQAARAAFVRDGIAATRFGAAGQAAWRRLEKALADWPAEVVGPTAKSTLWPVVQSRNTRVGRFWWEMPGWPGKNRRWTFGTPVRRGFVDQVAVTPGYRRLDFPAAAPASPAWGTDFVRLGLEQPFVDRVVAVFESGRDVPTVLAAVVTAGWRPREVVVSDRVRIPVRLSTGRVVLWSQVADHVVRFLDGPAGSAVTRVRVPAEVFPAVSRWANAAAAAGRRFVTVDIE